ncbi:MAG: DUF4976 domain-containing protein, partial [bacterium]|nr:DUF4976 domain-containing protein [bacterium]
EIDEWELFDLHKDGNELNNVYADPANAKLVGELKAELTRLRKHYKVPADTRPVKRKPRKRDKPKPDAPKQAA